MKRSNKYEETRLGRILNGIGTDKVTLKCNAAIQRWFESTRLAFSSFLRKIYKAYYEETVSSIGKIKFCDEEHANLCALNKHQKEMAK